jgi:hypothetical protein
MAPFSSSFQCCATSLASGSSGLGAPSKAWIDSLIISFACIIEGKTCRTVRICSAGDHLSLRISRQIRPSLSIMSALAVVTSVLGLTDVGVTILSLTNNDGKEIDILDLCQESHFGWVHGVLFW